MSHKIAVITTVYQNYTILKDFLTSFAKQSNKNFSLFIVDLSDTKKLIRSPLVPYTVIKDKNLGYAHGVNLGIKKAIGEGFKFFCIVNDDIYFNEDFINNVLKSIIYHPSSIIGGKINYAPGFEYHKNRYQETDLGKIIWYAGGYVDWKNIFIKHLGVDQLDSQKFSKFSPTDFVTGCLMIFDKSVIDRIGLWDEKYFLYFEDADFCERAKRRGIKLYYDPSIVIWHKNAQSTGGSGSTIHQKFQQKNRLRFGLKYASLRTKIHLIKDFFLTKTEKR